MKTQPTTPANHAPNPFLQKHQKDVMGILHAFDRLRLQGSLRYLYCIDIFEEYLSKAKVLFKDFKNFAEGLTAEVCQDAEPLAKSLGRPFIYLNCPSISKEDEARAVAKRDGITE